MPSLSRTDILGAKDLGLTPVEVPEWGGTVYVRSMTARERITWEGMIREQFVGARAEASGADGENRVGLEALEQEMADRSIHTDLLVRTVCDENGELLFTAEDIEGLEKKAWPPLRRVLEAAAKASGIALTGDGPPMVEDVGNY